MILGKLKKDVTLVLLGVIIVFVGIFIYKSSRDSKPDINYISATLKKSSELTSATVNMTGVYHYKDKGVPIINKTDFWMVYKATVRAGVDLDNVDIKSNNKDKIILKIPEAKILDVKVDAGSIQYFDDKLSLLNFDSRNDTNKATESAEKDAQNKAEETGILELANKQTESLIKSLIVGVLPKNYDVEVQFIKNTNE